VLLERKIAAAGTAGKPIPEDVLDELPSVHSELAAASQKLPDAGRGENALTKLLDSRAGNVRDYLAGRAGPGEHVVGRTPEALADSADDSGLVGKLIDAGDSIPVVDVLAATAGTVFGAKEDAQAHMPHFGPKRSLRWRAAQGTPLRKPPLPTSEFVLMTCIVTAVVCPYSQGRSVHIPNHGQSWWQAPGVQEATTADTKARLLGRE